jgi:hypothetical protein
VAAPFNRQAVFTSGSHQEAPLDQHNGGSKRSAQSPERTNLWISFGTKKLGRPYHYWSTTRVMTCIHAQRRRAKKRKSDAFPNGCGTLIGQPLTAEKLENEQNARCVEHWCPGVPARLLEGFDSWREVAVKHSLLTDSVQGRVIEVRQLSGGKLATVARRRAFRGLFLFRRILL